VSAVLWERTGGNPLFVTTLLDSWLERGLLGDGEPDLVRLSRDVPDTVLQLIEQMLDQIDPVDRDLLSAASAVGQEFSGAAAAAAAGLPLDEVDRRCDGLAREGRLIDATGEERWPDGTLAARYRFVHDLHREVLYGRLPPGQRAQVHARIGERLEVAYRTRPREVAARLAEHFVLADDAARAVRSLRLAAEQAFERLAHSEAVDHLTTALEMLEQLPDGPERWSEELALQSMLGAAEVAARGWSAVAAETAFLRTRDLAERLPGDELGPALFRLGTLYEVRGDYERSEALLEQTLERAGPEASRVLVADTHELLACSLFHQGDFDDALGHAERGLAVFDEEYLNPVRAAYGINAGAACHNWAAMSLWALGYPDLARTRAQEAVALAEDPRRRHGYAAALAQAATLEQCRLDVPATHRYAEAAVEAATEDGYPYRIAMGRIMLGWAMAAAGCHQPGIAELRRGLELSHGTGAHMDDPYYLALLADAHVRAGQIDEAWSAVEAGLALAPAGRGFFFESELHRTAGQLLSLQGRRDEAQSRMQEALEMARNQRSPSLELRAALTLARHLSSEGGDDAARGLVAGVYATFSEGFDTHDLVAARELLEQLGT
jgi:tetratricopeptide (TPR) repeat protein